MNQASCFATKSRIVLTAAVVFVSFSSTSYARSYNPQAKKQKVAKSNLKKKTARGDDLPSGAKLQEAMTPVRDDLAGSNPLMQTATDANYYNQQIYNQNAAYMGYGTQQPSQQNQLLQMALMAAPTIFQALGPALLTMFSPTKSVSSTTSVSSSYADTSDTGDDVIEESDTRAPQQASGTGAQDSAGDADRKPANVKKSEPTSTIKKLQGSGEAVEASLPLTKDQEVSQEKLKCILNENELSHADPQIQGFVKRLDGFKNIYGKWSTSMGSLKIGTDEKGNFRTVLNQAFSSEKVSLVKFCKSDKDPTAINVLYEASPGNWEQSSILKSDIDEKTKKPFINATLINNGKEGWTVKLVREMPVGKPPATQNFKVANQQALK